MSGLTSCTGSTAAGQLVDGYIAAGHPGHVAATESFVSSSPLATGNSALRDLLSTSLDAASSFRAPVDLEPTQGDQRGPVLIEEDNPSHVLVEVEHVSSAGGQYLEGSPGQVVVLRSTDGGRTFGPPVPLTRPVNNGAFSIGITETEGIVVAVYATVDASAVPGYAAKGYIPMDLHAAESRDDARTFGTSVPIGTYAFPLGAPFNPAATLVPVGSGIPSVSSWADGDVAVAWPDAQSGGIELARKNVGAPGWDRETVAPGHGAIEAEVAALGGGESAVFFYDETRATDRSAVVQPELAVVGADRTTTAILAPAFDLAVIKDGSQDLSPVGPMQGIAAVPGGVVIAADLGVPESKAGDVQAFSATIAIAP